ncbi:MAG: omptin family outer membrane protease [Candidatus Aureabacteria bacterium]|nr:omptin family outer membrane protease [Candidatus Auribacterota bacterium]
MKKVLSGFFLGVLLMGLSVNGYGYSEERMDGLTIWASGGYHDGSMNFRVSDAGVSRSELDYEMDGMYFTAGVHYQFVHSNVPKLSMTAVGTVSRHLEGTATDSDWLTYYSPDLWIYSKSDIDTDEEKYDLNLGYEFLNIKDGKFKLNLLGGYYWNSYKVKDYDVDTLIYDYEYIDVTTAGKAASYDAKFRGYYIGLDGAFKINEHWIINANFKGVPDIRAKATGKWVLRDFYFKQDATGKGYEMSLGTTFIPKENWAFELTVTKTSFNVEGDDDYFKLTDYTSGTYLGTTNLDFLKLDTYTTEIKVKYLF